MIIQIIITNLLMIFQTVVIIITIIVKIKEQTAYCQKVESESISGCNEDAKLTYQEDSNHRQRDTCKQGH